MWLAGFWSTWGGGQIWTSLARKNGSLKATTTQQQKERWVLLILLSSGELSILHLWFGDSLHSWTSMGLNFSGCTSASCASFYLLLILWHTINAKRIIKESLKTTYKRKQWDTCLEELHQAHLEVSKTWWFLDFLSSVVIIDDESKYSINLLLSNCRIYIHSHWSKWFSTSSSSSIFKSSWRPSGAIILWCSSS